MSGAVRSVVSIAVAVAIPFAAPAIAGSAFMAGVAGTIGATATSALVGAGMGALSAGIGGRDIGQGALFGGIGGGLAGYAGQAGAAGNATGAAGSAGTAGTAAPVYDYNAATGQFVPAPGFEAGAGLSGATAPIMQQGATAGGTFLDPYSQQQLSATSGGPGLSGATAGSPAAAGGVTIGGAPTTGAGLTMPSAVTAGSPAAMGGATMGVPMAGAAGAGAAGAGAASATPTFMQALKSVPGEIAAKFRDPKALADMTLRAGGMLAGSLAAGSGLSAEEQALLDAQTAELRQLQQTNEGLFRQRLEQAQNLIGESRYFDPEYYGLQSARRAQTQSAIATRQATRGQTGSQRAATQRRGDIETGRRTGTAYDVGFTSAVGPRLQTMQAGLSMMPAGAPSYSTEYENLRRAYSGASDRAAAEARGFGEMFGSLTGMSQARSTPRA